MPAIPLSPTTAPGLSPAESGGRLINAYGDALGGNALAPFTLRRTSGLTAFANTGNTGYRSSFADGPTFFSAWSGQLTKTDSGGASANIGVLPGTDWVTWARNAKTPTPDYVLTCAAGPYTFTAAGLAPLAGLPSPPVSVCYGDGFFFFPLGDGRVYASGLNDITINTLDRAQMQSTAATLVRSVWWAGELWTFSQKHCEVWGSGGNPNPSPGFPLRRTSVIPRGLIGVAAITGWENDFGGQLCWVADDNTVRTANGYSPDIISDATLTTLLERTTDKSTINMGCFIRRGHQCVYVRTPEFCWTYDFATQWWHERQSYLSPTWRLMGGANAAFGHWISGDANSGQLARVDADNYGEFDNPLIWLVESGPVTDFPARAAVSRVAFLFQGGTGLPAGGSTSGSDIDPHVEISFSDDNGTSWMLPIQRPIGILGQGDTYVDATMLGATKQFGRRWRLTVPDAVYVSLFGGKAAQQARA